MAIIPTADDCIGNHAQNQLRLAIANNGNDWDRDNRRRAQMIIELQKLDQTIAGYQQRHRELSAALAILDAVLPNVHRNTTQPSIPSTPEGADTIFTPERAAAPYQVTVTPERPAQ